MSYRATLSCDQPDCTTSLSASIDQVEFTLRYCDWKIEKTEQGTFYTCPGHDPDVLSAEHRLLAQAGRCLLVELKDLDERGYYAASCSFHGTGEPQEQVHIGDGCVLHLYCLEYEYPDGPYVQIIQQSHSIKARLLDRNGAVVFDEWADAWDD